MRTRLFATAAALTIVGTAFCRAEQPFQVGGANSAGEQPEAAQNAAFDSRSHKAPPAAAPIAPFALAPAAPPQDEARDDAPASPPPRSVNESALRYYATQNDMARVAIEIKRLHSLYPNWDPPQDLFKDAGSNVDEQPLWDLFAQGNYELLQEKITELQATQAGWQPSSDLTQKLEAALQRQQLVEASDAHQWGRVVEIASSSNKLLVCSRVDNIWRVAEALFQVGDKDRAYEAYRYILTSCKNPQERLATVQKASLQLPSNDLDDLIRMGRHKPDGTNEFQAVKLDLLRRKIGDAASNPAAEQPTQAEIEALSKSASASAKDEQLLGWYAYSRKDYSTAQSWFAKSLAADHDAKSAEGLAMSLRQQNHMDEAEDTAYTWRASGAEVTKQFIEIVAAQITATPVKPLTGDRQNRFAQAVLDDKSALGAQSLGWYLYNTGDLKGALPWFRKSVQWGASQEGVIGLAISAKRLGNTALFQQAIQTYRSTFPRVADLETMARPGGVANLAVVKVARAARPVPPARRTHVATYRGKTKVDEAVALFHAEKYNEAIAAINAMGPNPQSGMKILKGWALYHAGDWEGAKKTFAETEQAKPAEAAEGLRIVEQRQMPRFMQ